MVSISYLMVLIFSILGVVIYLNFETYRDTFESPEFPRFDQNISKFQEHEEFTSYMQFCTLFRVILLSSGSGIGPHSTRPLKRKQL